jgi:hypothetical protein
MVELVDQQSFFAITGVSSLVKLSVLDNAETGDMDTKTPWQSTIESHSHRCLSALTGTVFFDEYSHKHFVLAPTYGDGNCCY